MIVDKGRASLSGIQTEALSALVSFFLQSLKCFLTQCYRLEEVYYFFYNSMALTVIYCIIGLY